MADTAAFFANKKKKKKAFKFNANKIDAASVTTTIHVDAPALSTNNEIVPVSDPVVSKLADPGGADASNANASNDQWDDEALAAKFTKKITVASTGTAASAELLDMKSLDLKRNEEDDIAEKLRIEETKAKLVAAKEGMEREAQRIKDEKEKKEQAKQEGTGLRSGASGGKWVPSHMRAGASGGSLLARQRLGMSSRMPQKLDTQSEELFPDLASASKIIEEQKQQGPAYKIHKKTPVGGNATWGSRPKIINSKKVAAKSKEEEKPVAALEEEQAPPKKEEETSPETAEEPVAAAPVAATEAAAATPAVAPIKPKKKKKKDLSTFKKPAA